MKKLLLLSVVASFFLGSLTTVGKNNPKLTDHNQSYKVLDSNIIKKGKKAQSNKLLRKAKTQNISTLAKLTVSSKEVFSFNDENLFSRALEVPNVFGYLYYDLELETASFYKVGENVLDYLWLDPLLEDYELLASEGWYDDGKISGAVIEMNGNIIKGYYKYSLDFETGTVTNVEEFGLDIPIMFINARLNTEDGNIYGFAYDFDNEGTIVWATANPYDIANTSRVVNSKSTYCYSLCYNESDGNFYGFNTKQEFVTIDKQGNQTVITQVPEPENFATYFAGIVWVPSINAFYWNAQYADDASALYKVTLDGEFSILNYYPEGTEFTYLFTTETAINPDLPARPSFGSVNFIDGSLSGSVTFTMPTEMSDGIALPVSSPLDYTVLLDDVVYTTGKSATGDSVTINFSVDDTGYHKFSIFVTYDGYNSSLANRTIWIGNDTPLAPTNVTLTQTEVTWNAVGYQGIHGGYVNPDEVEYEIYINGNLVGTTSDTSLPVSFSEDATIAKYSATVYAIFDGNKGKGGSSNEILAGRPYQVPMYIEPTYDEFELMVIEDKNKDGITWGYWKDHNALGTLYTYNYEDYFDDYIFLPPVEITNIDKFYLFSLEAAIRAPNYPDEYLEVVYASAPSSESVMGILVPEFAPTAEQYDETWTRKEALWIVPSPGTYYIGIHATSPGDQLGLLAKSFRLTESDIDETSPSAPVINEVIPAANGGLNATVNFTYPSTLLNGSLIDEDASLSLNATVNGNPVAITHTGKPGENSSCVLETRQGRNEISIFVTLNNLDSPSDITSIFTGQTIPATPKNVKGEAAEDMMSIYLTWDPVTTPDSRNGYINPEDVRYAVYVQTRSAVAYHWQLISDDISDTHCTIKLQEGAPQNEYVFGVGSYNPAGTNDEVRSVNEILGTPYSLPMVDNFSNEESIMDLSPWFLYEQLGQQTYEAKWYTFTLGKVDEAFAGDDRAVLYCQPEKAGEKGLISIPRFSTLTCEEAQISLQVVTGANASDFSVLAQIYGTDKIFEVGSYSETLNSGSKISTVTFTLPEELLNQYWVQLYLEPSFNSVDELFILCGVEVTSSSYVKYITSNGSIIGEKNSIILKGFEGQNVIISSLDGKVLVDEKCKSDEMIYYCEKGIYIVTTPSKKQKIIVR